MNNFLFEQSTDDRKVYYGEIDFIKTFAIIAVIILHSSTKTQLYTSFAPFHIWHAVPLFMIVAGISSSLSAYKRDGFCISNEYSPKKLIKYGRRIIIPFTIVWSIEMLALILTGKATLGKVLYTYFTGGLGPGSYFTPLFIQHILIFPVIIWFKDKFNSYNQKIILTAFLVVSIILELMCIKLDVPAWFYRLLYVRYLFAAILGSYMLSHKFSKKLILALMPLSIFYIICASYLKIDFSLIYPAWFFQHTPAYFYTASLIYFLLWLYPFSKQVGNLCLKIGKASYHIFLFQMLWFWLLAGIVKKNVGNNIFYLILNILICIFFGYFFYKIEIIIFDGRFGLKAVTKKLRFYQNR